MDRKRKNTDALSSDGHSLKKSKTRKQWQTSRQKTNDTREPVASVEPGDAGIWVTCDMGKKGRCSRELLDLFDEYASRLYAQPLEAAAATAERAGSPPSPVHDIEAAIESELRELNAATAGRDVDAADPTAAVPALFTLVKGDTECLMFFKTRAPVDPASFVHTICSDAATVSSRARSRFVRRLTPMTLMGRASEKGLEEVARQVLAPVFHQPDRPAKKFAIRPTLRNHNVLSRDTVIKQVAAAVGPGHSVDLENYDALVLVDLYKNICGMSVVGPDYDRLKRFNLSELFQPAVKHAAV